MAVVRSGASRRTRRFGGSPAFGTLELLALLAALAYMEFAGWFAFKLTALQPHPYWLPVVLGAVCYGRSVGVFIAICAAGLDWALGRSALADYPDLYAFFVATSQEPILWLAAAVVLGGIRDRHAERLKEAEDALGQRSEEAQFLAEHCRALMQEANARDRLVAASDPTVAGSVLEMFHSMIAVSGRASLENYKQALNMLIGASDISVYVPTEFGWARLPAGDEHGASSVPSSICEVIAASEGVFSCLRPEEARVLDGHAAMAACVRRRDGRAAAVIFLGQVDPDCMTSAGEAAIALSSFILCNRYLEGEPLPLEHLRARQERPQLRVVNFEPRGVDRG